jgi:hypothetical protein
MNVTNWTAMDNFEQILSEANRFAPFWSAILLMLWTVLVIIFLPYGVNVAVLAGTFMALLLGVLLLYMNLVPFGLILMLIAVILLYMIIKAIFTGKDD